MARNPEDTTVPTPSSSPSPSPSPSPTPTPSVPEIPELPSPSLLFLSQEKSPLPPSSSSSTQPSLPSYHDNPSTDDVPSSSDAQPSNLPPYTDADKEARMRALRKKRRDRDRFILQSFGSGNVDEVGCLKGIRIPKENSGDESGDAELPSIENQKEFLRSIGAVLSTDIRPPLQLPTAEQVKYFEAHIPKRAKSARDEAPTDSGIPCSYIEMKYFKGKPFQYRMVTKCASLALDDYNLIENTKYRLVDLEKVGWRRGGGMHYYIVFTAKISAKTSEGKTEDTVETFEAEVKHCKVGKKRAGASSVVAVRMQKTGSKWHDGALQELVSWNY